MRARVMRKVNFRQEDRRLMGAKKSSLEGNLRQGLQGMMGAESRSARLAECSASPRLVQVAQEKMALVFHSKHAFRAPAAPLSRGRSLIQAAINL